MAEYNEVLGVLREFRNELAQTTQKEMSTIMTEDGETMRAFATRGGVSAFKTPLTNVHATGVGIRVKDGKIIEGEYVIKVYVFDKMDLGNRTPEITTSFQNIKIDVEALPIQMALNKEIKAPKAASKKTKIADHRQKHRPIIGGTSIAPLNMTYVGTLGCFLQRTVEGTRQVFALSNNHVIADTNRLDVGIEIVQPGPEVAPTNKKNVFASLSAYIPILFPKMRLDSVTNRYDAAIAAVTDEDLIKTSELLGIEKYEPSVGSAIPGMRVIKAGRTTGVTTGIVTATRVNGVQINYGTPQNPIIATFNDTVEIVSEDSSKSFSSPGDSGSVILDAATGRPVALLFAGDGYTTTACDFGGVCQQFQAFPV